MYNHRASIKAVLRHAVLRMGLERLRLSFHGLYGNTKIAHLNISTIPEVFSAIYKSDAWLAYAGQESLSGPGSTHAATDRIAVEISQLLESLQCTRLIDVGCGDFNWMKRVPRQWAYVGVDVVDEVIESNKRLYGPECQFFKLDATRDSLPPGDVVLCREILFHLSFGDIALLVENCRRTGARFFIATFDNDMWFNSDIRTGDFRPLNLCIHPFRFPEPLKRIADNYVSSHRSLAVWPMENVPVL